MRKENDMTTLTETQLEKAARKLCSLSGERCTKANLQYCLAEIEMYLLEYAHYRAIQQALDWAKEQSK